MVSCKYVLSFKTILRLLVGAMSESAGFHVTAHTQLDKHTRKWVAVCGFPLSAYFCKLAGKELLLLTDSR